MPSKAAHAMAGLDRILDFKFKFGAKKPTYSIESIFIKCNVLGPGQKKKKKQPSSLQSFPS